MRRNTAILLVAAFAAALAFAGIAGLRSAPSRDLYDRRPSISLSGPGGASGLAEALDALGVPAVRWRRSLFSLNRALAPARDSVAVALLDVSFAPTVVEMREVTRYVLDGGRVVMAGVNQVEKCFRTRIVSLARDRKRDSVVARSVMHLRKLPATRAVLAPFDIDSTEAATDPDAVSCATPPPAGVDTLLTTSDGRPVAWRQRYRAGGSVLILADARFITNEALKTTDAGVLIVPWFLGGGARRVMFDEYHLGFGADESIFATAWAWAIARPLGWALLQLVLAGLLALLAMAIRFGPAVRVVERRRRSPLEHVEAVAVGLERSGASDVAVELLAGGLRRRLGRTIVRGQGSAAHRAWLDALGRSARTDAARRAVQRFRAVISHPRDGETVLAAATAVEDVWEALKRPIGSPRS